MPSDPASRAPPKRVFLIANPRAGRAAGRPSVLQPMLAARGIEVAGTGAGLPSGIEGEVDAVVLAGGDGTVNRNIGDIMGSGLPFGLIPTGTANDLARTLGIPNEPMQAVGTVAAGRTRTIDVGTVNDGYFLNVASIGLAAEVSENLTDATKQRFGKLGYALTAAMVVLRKRRFTAWIACENETIEVRTLQIAVGNGVHYGGGNVVHRDAAIDDAQLDLYSLEFENLWRLFMALPWFRTGLHGTWEEVRNLHGTRFELRTKKPRPVNIDGDILTHTPAVFGVLPAAACIFVPSVGFDPLRAGF